MSSSSSSTDLTLLASALGSWWSAVGGTLSTGSTPGVGSEQLLSVPPAQPGTPTPARQPLGLQDVLWCTQTTQVWETSALCPPILPPATAAPPVAAAGAATHGGGSATAAAACRGEASAWGRRGVRVGDACALYTRAFYEQGMGMPVPVPAPLASSTTTGGAAPPPAVLECNGLFVPLPPPLPVKDVSWYGVHVEATPLPPAAVLAATHALTRGSGGSAAVHAPAHTHTTAHAPAGRPTGGPPAVSYSAVAASGAGSGHASGGHGAAHGGHAVAGAHAGAHGHRYGARSGR